jgi:hypothetical protein
MFNDFFAFDKYGVYIRYYNDSVNNFWQEFVISIFLHMFQCNKQEDYTLKMQSEDSSELLITSPPDYIVSHSKL